MLRLTADGLLIGYGSMLLWFVIPMAGTLVAHALWFSIWSLVEWKVPEAKKVKAAREADRQTILALKAELADTLREMVRAQGAEATAKGVLEEVRSTNRNINARATEALK